jgi:hypothetical protein
MCGVKVFSQQPSCAQGSTVYFGPTDSTNDEILARATSANFISNTTTSDTFDCADATFGGNDGLTNNHLPGIAKSCFCDIT